MLGNAVHVEAAQKAGNDAMSEDDLKNNKNKKLVKKLAAKYDYFLGCPNLVSPFLVSLLLLFVLVILSASAASAAATPIQQTHSKLESAESLTLFSSRVASMI